VSSRVDAAYQLRNRFARRLLGRQFSFDHSRALAREYARIFARRLREVGPVDLIFAPAASTQISRLETDIPIVYASDTTFQLLRDYHQDFTGIGNTYAATGNETERRAIHNAAAVTYPSQWAARSAVSDYGASPKRVSVIPWGPNVDQVPDAARVSAERKMQRCSLLFLGVNWERKGGPTAYRAAEILNRRGLDVTLTVCGVTPPEEFRADWFRVIPFLNKQVPAEREELTRLQLAASFFVLPTLNDCYPMVLAESAAHGTPSVVTNTGGISEAVAEGRSGFLMPMEAASEEYADVIQSVWSDQDHYRRLVKTSREHYDTIANWDHWGAAMNDIIGNIL
jgi:glycosyltransferase involved in cell wall biosynthesis